MISNLATLSLLICLLAAVIGLINPSTVKAKSRTSAFFIYISAAFVSLAILGSTAEKTSKTSAPPPATERATNAIPDSGPVQSPQPSSANKPRQVAISSAQKKLIEVVNAYAKKYREANNQLKKSALVPQFERAIHEALLSDKDMGFVGIVEDLSTTTEGKASFSIRLLDSDVRVGTWNNEFSDVADNTLIPQNSSLYKMLSDLQMGNMVRIFGSFGREKSVTEQGKMTDPEFLFRFKSVEKIADTED